MILYPPTQTLQSLDPKDYRHAVIVCGSRDYNNKLEFHEKLLDYLTEFDSPVLFISGAAPTGADDLIIRWCMKFGYPCLKVPADWDNLGKGAGFLRNIAMSQLATHVLAFYDGQSPGTKHMLRIAEENSLKEKIILISIDPYAKPQYKKSVRVD